MELKGGLIVHDDAVTLALDLERGGHAITSRDGALLVTNGSTLSVEQRTSISKLKRHLLAIASYEAPS